MKTLTVRRHTQRTKPGQNLSQQGIDLANLISANSGPFDLVATANIPRAIQTAIALGHQITHAEDALGHLPRKIFEKSSWPNGFAQISAAFSKHKSVANYARKQADLWKSITDQIPSSGHALIISHGAIIELGIIASLPKTNHANWGTAMGYCEGIRFTYNGDNTSSEFLRVPENYRQVHN